MKKFKESNFPIANKCVVVENSQRGMLARSCRHPFYFSKYTNFYYQKKGCGCDLKEIGEHYLTMLDREGKGYKIKPKVDEDELKSFLISNILTNHYDI